MDETTLGDIGARLAAIELELREQRALIERVQRLAAETRQLVGPCGIPVSQTELLVQTLFGVKFYVPADDQIMTPQLVVYRQWEPGLSQLMLHLAPAGSVFVDVGANLGYFTCLVAAAMGATAGSRVIAVEPNPHMLRLLEINTRINWSMAPVSILPFALSDVPGTGQLHVPAQASANAALVADGQATASEPRHEVAVEVHRLDDVLRKEPRVDLLKVDVEGFETAVFRGGAATLRRPELRIVFEWAQKQTLSAGYAPALLLELLRDHGYRLHDADLYLGDPAGSERSDDDLMAMQYGNLLALRDAPPDSSPA